MHWVWTKSQDPELEGFGKGIRRSPDEHGHFSFDLLPPEKEPFVAHLLHHGDELDRVDVVDVLCVRMVSEGLVIP